MRSPPRGNIGLLQCRLAMTGSPAYTQPFHNELTLAHNGEIYNYSHLRNYLEGKGGVSFETDVDSEVILRLLEYLLEGGLNIWRAVRKAMTMLEGDYAVALSDGGGGYTCSVTPWALGPSTTPPGVSLPPRGRSFGR